MSASFANKKIAVIGGGLGGMAFLNAAVFAGLENIHLYERAPEFTEVGAGVSLTQNANRIIDAYGLGPSMLWKSSHHPPVYMQYNHSETNKDLGHITEWGEPSTRQIHRAHLLDCFKERVPESMYSLGKRLVSIEDSKTGSPYLLTFSDGTTTEADIVIGCDGIKSTVRQHLGFQDHPTYSGQVVYRGYVSYSDISPATAKQLRDMVIFRGRQKHILTMPIGRGER